MGGPQPFSALATTPLTTREIRDQTCPRFCSVSFLARMWVPSGLCPAPPSLFPPACLLSSSAPVLTISPLPHVGWLLPFPSSLSSGSNTPQSSFLLYVSYSKYCAPRSICRHLDLCTVGEHIFCVKQRLFIITQKLQLLSSSSGFENCLVFLLLHVNTIFLVLCTRGKDNWKQTLK